MHPVPPHYAVSFQSRDAGHRSPPASANHRDGRKLYIPNPSRYARLERERLFPADEFFLAESASSSQPASPPMQARSQFPQLQSPPWLLRFRPRSPARNNRLSAESRAQPFSRTQDFQYESPLPVSGPQPAATFHRHFPASCDTADS